LLAPPETQVASRVAEAWRQAGADRVRGVVAALRWRESLAVTPVVDGVLWRRGWTTARRTVASDYLARRAARSLWPMVADVGVRIRRDPAVEHVRERCRLGAAAGEVLLQHDD
jgi:hypothetical protein